MEYDEAPVIAAQAQGVQECDEARERMSVRDRVERELGQVQNLTTSFPLRILRAYEVSPNRPRVQPTAVTCVARPLTR